MTNLHLDCGLVTLKSDKEVVPSALSQRLSGLKMMVWLCSPVLTRRTPQSKLPRRGVGGVLRVLGISGVKKVGCGCYTGVKWYVEGGARGREWRDRGEDLDWKEVEGGVSGEGRRDENRGRDEMEDIKGFKASAIYIFKEHINRQHDSVKGVACSYEPTESNRPRVCCAGYMVVLTPGTIHPFLLKSNRP